MEIRNIAIIAHVDHGKTTITDALMRQTGAVTNESVVWIATLWKKSAALLFMQKCINVL